MSATGKIVDRAMEDESFLMELKDNPESALDGYDVQDEAADAIKSGDEDRIREVLGLGNSEPVVVVVVVA